MSADVQEKDGRDTEAHYEGQGYGAPDRFASQIGLVARMQAVGLHPKASNPSPARSGDRDAALKDEDVTRKAEDAALKLSDTMSKALDAASKTLDMRGEALDATLKPADMAPQGLDAVLKALDMTPDDKDAAVWRSSVALLASPTTGEGLDAVGTWADVSSSAFRVRSKAFAATS